MPSKLARKVVSSLRYARAVAALQDKGLAAQAVEIAQMRRRNPTLGASDYYWYGLYDPQFIAATRVEDYLGWRVEDDVSRALNPRHLAMPAWDKFTLHLFARAHGLPMPRVYALYKPGRKLVAGDVASLTTPEELAAWLRTWERWPVFAKPSSCRQSVGCYHFVGYDRATDSLRTRKGALVGVPKFVAEVGDDRGRSFYHAAMGYLFQEVVYPHRDISALLASEAVSGVRVVLLHDEHGIELVTVMWKLTTGDNELDAFRGGEDDTYLANLDPATGRIACAIDDWRPYGNVVTAVKSTGRSLAGFTLPMWNEVLTLCLAAASVFPLIRLQHWDIAITDAGPVILEVNDFGALVALQLFGRGVLTDRLRAQLRRSPEAGRFPWIGRLCGAAG